MQTKESLKARLLETGLFLDNSYLDKYIDLMLTKNKLTIYTEKHHILQRKYFKVNNLPVDNSVDNVVNLSYCEHCKAHWLLYFCTTGYLKKANEISVKYIADMYTTLSKVNQKNKLTFNDIDFNLLQDYKISVINDECSRYWSEEEINYLKENYKDYGSGPKCAKYLCRSVRMINEKAKQLGLSANYPNWTAEELETLVQYYPINGDKVYLRFNNHSRSACRVMAAKLKIRVKTHYWTAEDIKLFKENKEKPLTDIVKLFPGRTYASIKHYWQRHIKNEEKDNG